MCTVREYFKASSSYWCVSFWMEKRKYCSHSQKTATNKILKIIDQFLYFRFVVKYLKDLFLTKIFERLIYFSANKLISKNQSGFQPGDSCINQLLSITHEILRSFDYAWEVRSVSLDISKAFDKVWHEELIFKLKRNGISCELLHILSYFLRNRK